MEVVLGVRCWYLFGQFGADTGTRASQVDSEGFGEEEPHLLEEPIAWCWCKVGSTVEGSWVCPLPEFRCKVDDANGTRLV